ncbi:MAG TPA: copper resistance CopC family protein [Steroidobacteraceae bacterium]
MRVVRWSCTAALLVCSALAFAHAHLQRSVPAEGSRLSAAPQNLVLVFAEPARLTALWLQKDKGAKEPLRPLPGAAATELSVPLHSLAAGSYVVTWRVLSADGHVMPGRLSFTVTGEPATSSAP